MSSFVSAEAIADFAKAHGAPVYPRWWEFWKSEPTEREMDAYVRRISDTSNALLMEQVVEVHEAVAEFIEKKGYPKTAAAYRARLTPPNSGPMALDP